MKSGSPGRVALVVRRQEQQLATLSLVRSGDAAANDMAHPHIVKQARHFRRQLHHRGVAHSATRTCDGDTLWHFGRLDRT